MTAACNILVTILFPTPAHSDWILRRRLSRLVASTISRQIDASGPVSPACMRSLTVCAGNVAITAKNLEIAPITKASVALIFFEPLFSCIFCRSQPYTVSCIAGLINRISAGTMPDNHPNKPSRRTSAITAERVFFSLTDLTAVPAFSFRSASASSCALSAAESVSPLFSLRFWAANLSRVLMTHIGFTTSVVRIPATAAHIISSSAVNLPLLPFRNFTASIQRLNQSFQAK
mmetsp:Transcript_5420/g.8037  ORF Transcript_5420/g.8037 Transcript_5420/m.8037 type:complete len:232 (-) Transcript_5420:106-801(-)